MYALAIGDRIGSADSTVAHLVGYENVVPVETVCTAEGTRTDACSIMSPLMDKPAFVKAQLPPAPARVLEVGCGDGRLARALDDLGYGVTAIDPAAPEGAIFRPVSLEEFADPGRFDAVVASRALHHIADLGGALSKLQHLLVRGGRLIVVEHAWERLDGSTASWYLERRRATDPGAPSSLDACLAEWEADHAGLHDSTVLRRELDRRFTERFFAWTPYLYGELGEEFEREERRLIEAGAINATGFVYVGEKVGS
jgi:SAM-dependent methyltransferase